MSHSILMISDLHLSETHPEITSLFIEFLEKRAAQAKALYILGDFFEAWIGDDDDSPFVKKISSLLLNLSKQGIKIYFMPGNRDFLLGKDYCKRAGMTLLADPYSSCLLGHAVLLSHGDLLCTQDKSYQRFRCIVRNKIVQRIFYFLPLAWRKKLARALRQQSGKSQIKRGVWCDVSQTAVKQWANQYPDGTVLIHGHTHEFKIHTKGKIRRYVLGDWSGSMGSYIEITEEEIALKPFLKATS